MMGIVVLSNIVCTYTRVTHRYNEHTYYRNKEQFARVSHTWENIIHNTRLTRAIPHV